ncbi:ATP-dependent DNA helicase [Trichonephila clavipes]|nr:ATP-dependent DNA helicase [Trichonephila clavipes]
MLYGNCTKNIQGASRKKNQTGEDGYPQYRRRSPEDGGIVTQIKGNNVDNRWVVPYNPVLSRKFNAHINVEFCNSVKSIKYIYKYVNKGTDQATFSVEDQDEVTRRKKGKAVSGYPETKKDQVLGRVYTVHPGNAECYYLRLLLHKIPGPTSFTALKIVTGVVQPSFQAACKALGLLEDDAHWNSTLEEASISESLNKIRELFAIILDPMKLWEKHRDSLSEDVKKQIEAQQGNINLYLDIVYNQCFILLEDIVISMSGKDLLQFGFLFPSREARSAISNHQYVKERAYDTVHLSKIVAENVPKLNQEQKEIYDKILNSISSNSGQCFISLIHLVEPEKVFLINLLLAKIRCERSIAIAVASSGIAATLIDGGKTAHSAFKLPLNLHHSESVNCNISKQSDMAHVLREAKLIIWDECTMEHKKGIEALNRTLQDIRGCNQIMGGLTVLLSGDFRQTLPVVFRGTRADIVKACVKTPFLWPHIKVVSLKINMRVHLQHDLRAEIFSKLLIDIGDGKIKEMEGRINIPERLGNIVGDLITLTERIYPNIHQIGIDCSSWLKERAILTPTNDSANNINNFLLNKLTSKHAKYESVDSVMEAEDAVYYSVEFLNTLNPPGIPPHVLNLKIGAPIMLLRNLNLPKLCNGTKLQVKNLHNNVI